jgi:hypothetical protein
MARVPIQLRRLPTERALLDDVRTSSDIIGLTGLLAVHGCHARRVSVPGSAAAEGFRWTLRDRWTQTWWPQGVSVGEHEGIPLAMVSWYAQPRRGRSMGSRLSILDLRDTARPKYHHVLLVAARRDGRDITYDAVRVHAGGIAWAGDRIFVAATFGGIREFRLSDIVRAPSRGPLHRATGPFGHRFLLPEFARYEPPGQHDDRMRYSFISLESASDSATDGATPKTAPADPGNELRLIVGEYGTGDKLRLGRMRLGDDRAVIDEIHAPGIADMQGAVVHDGRWFVSVGRGDKSGGDLWVGTPGAMTRRQGVLPPGPEDLAVWPERDQLWCVTEFPRKRWVFAMDIELWTSSGG